MLSSSPLLRTVRPFLHTRRLAGLLGTLLLLGAAGLPARAAAPGAPARSLVAETDAVGILADSVGAPDWARRVAALRRALVAIDEATQPDSADARTTRAFAEARALAAAPGMLRDVGFRALFLDVQAAYERRHGAVRSFPLTAAEVGALRGAVLADFVAADGHPALARRNDPPAPPPVPDVVAPEADAVHAMFRYPASAGPLVEQQAAQLTRTFRGFGGVRQRARRYFPIIERALARRGVPTDLKYLAVVESGLDPGAISSAGAVGMWQFLPATGAMYGLDSLALLNPTRASTAAASHLRALARQFGGDWQLALAAYNCGPGRVEGIVRAHRRRLGRTPTYWDIHRALPRETRDYVPRFIALARILGGVPTGPGGDA